MRIISAVVSVIAALGLWLVVQSAASAAQIFGPFMVSDGPESAIVLNGEIDLSAALNFRRALAAAPGARVLVLNSPGDWCRRAC